MLTPEKKAAIERQLQAQFWKDWPSKMGGDAPPQPKGAKRVGGRESDNLRRQPRGGQRQEPERYDAPAPQCLRDALSPIRAKLVKALEQYYGA